MEWEDLEGEVSAERIGDLLHANGGADGKRFAR